VRRARQPARRRRRYAALATAAGLLALALGLAGLAPWQRGGSGAIAQAGGEPLPQTDASVPARHVTLIGATPEEPGAPGAAETWGVGRAGSSDVLVRYAGGPGWSRGPALPAGFTMDSSPLAGKLTVRGAGVMLGTVPVAGGKPREAVLVRDPGGAFAETARVAKQGETTGGEEPLLSESEDLYATSRSPLAVPLDESGAGTGALVVPVQTGSAGVEHQVLHWAGGKWTSEPIEIPEASAGGFRVLAIAASAPDNAWLLAQLAPGSAYPEGAVALFRRVSGSGEPGFSWKPVTLSAGGGDGEAHPLVLPVQGGGSAPFTVFGTGEPPSAKAQLLTVTGAGVWVDGERADVHGSTPVSATLYFKPEGSAGGQIEADWCFVGGSSNCQHELPQVLPNGFTRSFAWPGSGFGDRVISGLAGGVSLRLRGDEFVRVLSLGAGEGPEEDPGAQLGSAFTSPNEGWLGEVSVPVHLTTQPAASRLAPWPVPFRYPLLAIAPEPGAAIGGPSSEALAVGDRGQVARYHPGQGWLPESLFGPGGKVAKPRLRAVAWPNPNRAFAVGDQGVGGEQMWLWRGETGLWEPDPATPLNFRGNLLGIAFDPNNSSRGYAVGTSSVEGGGVLLRYGKSWTQETGLPAAVAGAQFVAVAFAGSEAIVAYRVRVNGNGAYTGGLLVNDGSGWHVDQEATALVGAAEPEAVAGLPDGGAAFATSGGGEGPHVFERQSSGAPWAATSTPVPGLTVGSLALFREGGALRAVVSGGGVGNSTEGQAPPPGRPPNEVPPLSPRAGLESGDVLRQTGTGWNDEGHELNPLGAEPGGYLRYDMPYHPDSVYAVMVDPSGTQGWAVGGDIGEDARLETSNVERYPAESGIPREEEPVPDVAPGTPESEQHDKFANFAIGGHAECASPCADRSYAGVGPQVWLSSAIARAQKIGARAFLYTGPSVTQGLVSGPRSLPLPFLNELSRTASILASAPNDYAAAATPDLDERPEREGTEASFLAAYRTLPQFNLSLEDRARQGCEGATPGCQVAYYAFPSPGNGGSVRVIVLDDSGDVNAVQLHWLEEELAGAKALGEPAIAVGSADLRAQVNAGDTQAAAVAKVLVTGSLGSPAGACASSCASASAYFFDSPEQNVKEGVSAAGEAIPAFGSGTLGYVFAASERYSNFHGASGILLGQVDLSRHDPQTNRAAIATRLIPVIGDLGVEAKDGALLHRSQPALFSGLARRPRAGGVASGSASEAEIDPYIPIPSNCTGECGSALLPEYEFTSSNPDIGDFVAHNTASPDPHAVLQNAQGEPIRSSQWGLFCAFNKGETTVKIRSGGLVASLVVHVLAGSVRQPCGTTPLKNPSASQQVSSPAPPPAQQPSPASAAPSGAPPPVPLPPAPAVPAPAPAPSPFVPLAAIPAPLLAFVPPPVPTPARPTPPSGTSAVTSPIEVTQEEEEEEEATESVSNQAVAYRSGEHDLPPEYILGVLVLAAFAGASIRRRPRRGRRGVEVAPATITGARAQRRASRLRADEQRRWRRDPWR
jgi:hypothetical protein